MTAYYNENDPFAAAWLRELIKANHIAEGDVDERSIEDVFPKEIEKYTQCHFFAGVGGWSYALRQAGWRDDQPVWTGSCPCQPFSAAGKGAGFTDERHLWPSWFHLIENAKPGDVPIFGEQVASPNGLTWFDLVSEDLEGAGYTVGANDTCAAGFGAPHIRQRLYFMADNSEPGRPRRRSSEAIQGAEQLGRSRTISELGHHPRLEGRRISGKSASELAFGQTGMVSGFWEDADWIYCRDEKWRPVEPGAFPLAHRAANRVGRLRGYGNCIVIPQAKAFIEAYREIRGI